MHTRDSNPDSQLAVQAINRKPTEKSKLCPYLLMDAESEKLVFTQESQEYKTSF